MKLNVQFFFVPLFFMMIAGNVFSQQHMIENRKWELEKFRDSKSGRMTFVDEYHYLEFRDERVFYSIDCNRCSSPYQFVSKDTIQVEGPPMCTRKGCLEKDAFSVTYDGKYKIWRQGIYLYIRTKNGDLVYR